MCYDVIGVAIYCYRCLDLGTMGPTDKSGVHDTEAIMDLMLKIETEENNLAAEIEELQADLDGIRRFKKRILKNYIPEAIPGIPYVKPGEQLRPTDAVRLIIYSQSDKRWTVAEITRRLEIMIQAKLISTTVRNTSLRPYVAVIVRRLYQRNLIAIGGKKGELWYSKPIVLEMIAPKKGGPESIDS